MAAFDEFVGAAISQVILFDKVRIVDFFDAGLANMCDQQIAVAKLRGLAQFVEVLGIGAEGCKTGRIDAGSGDITLAADEEIKLSELSTTDGLVSIEYIHINHSHERERVFLAPHMFQCRQIHYIIVLAIGFYESIVFDRADIQGKRFEIYIEKIISTS